MNQPQRIAFATRRSLSDLTDDDRLLLDYLNGVVARAESAVWDDPTVPWKEFDTVIIRSCWDYHLRPTEFLGWISLLERAGVQIWNLPSVVRWNMDKSYLRDLERKNVTVAATAWIDKGASVNLKEILEFRRWEKAVVKPRISATAFQTFVTSAAAAKKDQPLLDNILLRSGAMVQEFIEQIPADGEWSLIFFNKQYSHAVLKRAKVGDYRVQHDFGGHLAVDIRPTDDLIEQARRIVESVDQPLLYARVDGVTVEETLVLMELELIEPFLFFSSDLDSVIRFGNALTLVNQAASSVANKNCLMAAS